MLLLPPIRPPGWNACRLWLPVQARHSSSKRWQARQQQDRFTKEAAVQGLKSRAAFKLLQVPTTGRSLTATRLF
jgi:21S rRNA (uridine2791-2'-O)-methyltransferase